MISWKALLAVAGATLIGSSGGLFIKAISLSPMALAALRMLIPVMVLLPMEIRLLKNRHHEPGRGTVRWAAFWGSLFNALRMALYIWSFQLTEIGNAVVIFYSWPVFAVLFESLQERRKVQGSKLLLLGLSLFGVALMNLHRGMTFQDESLIGSLAMLLSALFYAVATRMFKLTLGDASIPRTLLYQNGLGALLFLPFLIAEWNLLSPRVFGLSTAYAMLIGLGAFGLFFYGLRHLPVFMYGNLTYLEVIFAVLVGIFFNGERLVPGMVLGAVLVLGSSLLARGLSEKPDLRPGREASAQLH